MSDGRGYSPLLAHVVWIYPEFCSTTSVPGGACELRYGRTDHGVKYVLEAVRLRRRARQWRVEIVAEADESLARRHRALQGATFGPARIVVHGVRALADVVRDAGHLHVRVRDAVREDHARESDAAQERYAVLPQLQVLGEEDGGDVRCVRAPVALRGDVERRGGVRGKGVQEELQEGIDVVRCCGRCAHFRTVVGVGIANVDGLVEEDHVRMTVPAELVPCSVQAIVGDIAWPKFEEQTSDGAASWSAVQPQGERIPFW